MAQVTRKNGRTLKVRESVEQIWLAGLGALALTEEEGTKFFRTLVKKGEGFERQTRSRIDDAVTAGRKVQATTLTRIETGWDDTMTSVLGRLGVPSKQEIASLTRRIEGLSHTLEASPAKKTPARPRARKRVTREEPATPTA